MDPMPDPTRERLKNLRNGLLRLHKSLLDSEKAFYERDVARITTTGQYLDLVLNDPWFAWLRDLSQFVVLIDETLDLEEPVTAAHADRLVAQARDLISPTSRRQRLRPKVFRSHAARSQRRPRASRHARVFTELQQGSG